LATAMQGRHAAEIDGDFVVFLIGARFELRHPVRTFRDLGGRRGMKHMLDYLSAHPERGLLAYEMGLPTIVQYWRSFEHLEAFAKNTDDPHLAVWRNYGSARPPAAGSGTRPTWYGPVTTRRSMRTQRCADWARPGAWSH